MKLLRFGERGNEKPGLLDAGGTIRDLSGRIDDIGPDALAPESLARLAGLDPSSLPAVDPNVRIGPCVANVGKLLCIGLNYSDHAAETGSPIPSEPILFMKATSAINGPNDPVVAPRGSTKLDWEVELGIVIGRRASYVEADDALDYVAGYCVANDVSEREFQIERPGRPVDQGQELRHVRPDRPLDGHQGRGARPPGPRPLARGERAPVPGREHLHDDLRREDDRQLRELLHDPRAGRCHPDRHSARSRGGAEAPALPPRRAT